MSVPRLRACQKIETSASLSINVSVNVYYYTAHRVLLPCLVEKTIGEVQKLRVNISDFEKKCTIGRGHYGEVSISAYYPVVYLLVIVIMSLYGLLLFLMLMLFPMSGPRTVQISTITRG